MQALSRTGLRAAVVAAIAALFLPGESRAQTVAAGAGFSCALTTAGGVKCWGVNQYGQLGNGTTTQSTSPVDVRTSASDATPLSGVTAIEAGNYHACALLTDGTVRCWGLNGDGRTGDGTFDTPRSSPVEVVATTAGGTALSGVTALSARGAASCAVVSGGGLKCWGNNASGQLGDGSTTNRNVPVDVRTSGSDATPLSGVAAVTGGEYTSCARLSTGSVKCWGYQGSGAVGNGSSSNSSVTSPVDVRTSASDAAALSGVTALSANGNFACARLTSEGAKCWGQNDNGQLGDGTTTSPRTSPVDVRTSASDATPLTGVTELAGGENHTCARLTSGEVRCWGGNGNGQLGDGTTTTRTSPVGVVGFTATTVAHAVTGASGLGNDQGWRVLAAPVSGMTRADLEDDVTFETGTGHVLYTHNGAAYVAVTASATALTNGRGFLLYLFDDAVNPFTSDRTLDVTGFVPTADVTVSDLNTAHQWHLLGNPYDASFALSSLALVSNGFQANVQVWNARTRTWQLCPSDPACSGGVVTAWQGFFVERDPTTLVTPLKTSLTLPYSGRTTGGTFIGKGGEAARLPLRLQLRDGDGAVMAQDEAAVEARAEAREGWDAYDASKRDPLAATFATVALGGTRGNRPWWHAVRSLPEQEAGMVAVPIRVRTSTGGRVRLSWGAVPAPWHATLRDLHTGTSLDLGRDSVYSFAVAGAADDSTRLVLQLTPRGATATDGARPAGALEASGVWPSPARRTARIVLRTGSAERVRVALYDALGRRVADAFDGVVAPGVRAEVPLPVADLPPGVYVVHVAGARTALHRTFTVVR